MAQNLDHAVRNDRPLVQVLSDKKHVGLLIDPMRREILRLLSRQPLTERHLSKALGLSPPSIGHHLKPLKDGNLISIVRREAGNHGIVQKFYSANARVFVVEKEGMPTELKRYYMPMDIERARGVSACLSLLRDEAPNPTSESIERLSDDLVDSICQLARKYEGASSQTDPEVIIHALYKGALKKTVKI